jgi:hypothetical protein
MQHRGLAPEVPGRAFHVDRGQAGSSDLDAWCDRFQRGYHRLESARLGSLVPGEHREFGAAGLCLTPP